ncbi:MAG TPA: protoporphyrinogen oxidase [Symbiobacteriaceae bacterium]
MTQRVVIAGGGITGLTAAYRLQQKARTSGIPAEILVVEREPRLGGKTQTEKIDGFIIEQGPDSFIAFKPWFGQLCRELGLPTVGPNPKVKTTYIYFRGRMEQLPVGMQIMIPTQIWPFLKTRLLSPMGKLRAGLEPFIPPRRSDEDESIASFVRRRFGREILENLAGPLMGGIYGGDYEIVSMKTTFPRFMEMERTHGSLLLATWRNKKKYRPQGPTGSPFETIPTGLHDAVEALVRASTDVRYLAGTSLEGLAPAESEGGYHLLLSNGDRLRADAVVLATPAYVSADLMRDRWPEVADLLAEIPYGNSVVVALAYRRKDVAHPLDASGFLVPIREPLEVTASTWVSSKWPHAAPPDKVLLRCFVGRAYGRDWTQEPDEVILDTVKRNLAQVMGLTAEPLFTRIYRWPRAMAQYRVGHLDRMDHLDRLMQQIPGLFLAGAAYRGIGLPDCTREGNQAAEKVARYLGWNEPKSS